MPKKLMTKVDFLNEQRNRGTELFREISQYIERYGLNIRGGGYFPDDREHCMQIWHDTTSTQNLVGCIAMHVDTRVLRISSDYPDFHLIISDPITEDEFQKIREHILDIVFSKFDVDLTKP